MKNTVNFETATAVGQKRLMAQSMGLDSEAYLRRPLHCGASAEQGKIPSLEPQQYALIGLAIRATWMPKTFNSVSEGIIIKVDPVYGSESHRLVILKADGSTQRCYTNSADWMIEIDPPKAIAS
jgi:hypothetical protein